jgi:hypothetical protein
MRGSPGFAAKARPDPVGLADQVFTALSANDYGVFDGLVTAMIPALGDAGTAHLKNRPALADRPRKAGGRGSHTSLVRSALQDIADVQKDVDAYIALVPVQDRSRPHVGAEIGRRLLAAGRTIEALAALENARPNKRTEQAGITMTSPFSGMATAVHGKRFTSMRSMPLVRRSRPSSFAGQHSRNASQPFSCAPT